VAVWTALVFLYLVLRRNRADMRMILGGAAVLLLVGSFGPQGAYGTTGASQFARLKSFLEAKGVLKDGKVAAVLPTISNDDYSKVDSGVFALQRVNQLNRLRNWFDGQRTANWPSDGGGYSVAYEVRGLLTGRDNVDQTVLQTPQTPVNLEQFALMARKPVDRAWGTKARIIGPIDLWSNNLPGSVSVRTEDKKLILKIDQLEHGFELGELTKQLKAATSSNFDQTKINPLVIDLDQHVSILISQASGEAGAKARLSSMTFWIVQHE
jgi:hypothetical protein